MTPIRINLLPHRQMKRAHQRRVFALFSLLVIALGIGIVSVVQGYLAGAKATQDRRNDFLKAEIAKLDQQIAEIQQLKEKTQDLISRKNVVESLQANRGQSVRLFDQLARQLPDGVYLKGVKQNGDSLALTGYAQSSARVSTFMRSLDESELFQEPVLLEVRSALVNNQRVSEFALNVNITRQAAKQETPKQEGKKS
jgi:type IV pilus assembly protein PilN